MQIPRIAIIFLAIALSAAQGCRNSAPDAKAGALATEQRQSPARDALLAPAWVADQRTIYGGFFWINGDGGYPAPKEAYYMAGAGGQTTFIIPSHDLVVVRLGHFKGDAASDAGHKKALALLLEAVPPRKAR